MTHQDASLRKVVQGNREASFCASSKLADGTEAKAMGRRDNDVEHDLTEEGKAVNRGTRKLSLESLRSNEQKVLTKQGANLR